MKQILSISIFATILVISACTEKKNPVAEKVAAIKAEQRPASEVIKVRQSPAPESIEATKAVVLSTDPAFVALSSEEASWLAQNGFLTFTQLKALRALGEQTLLNRSRENNDAAAATALGMLRLKNGDTSGAIIALDRAARFGSLYALEQLAYAELSDTQMGSTPNDIVSENNALIRFSARMEQARIMGDHRVDYYLDRVAGNLDRQRYGDQILRQTTEYMRQFAEDASIRGVPGRAPNSRPNIDKWQQISVQRDGTTSALIR